MKLVTVSDLVVEIFEDLCKTDQEVVGNVLESLEAGCLECLRFLKVTTVQDLLIYSGVSGSLLFFFTVSNDGRMFYLRHLARVPWEQQTVVVI